MYEYYICKLSTRTKDTKTWPLAALGWYYNLFDTLLRNRRIAVDFGNIACDFGKVHTRVIRFYVNISRINATGFVIRYLTIEYSVLHLLRYSSK